MQVSSGAAAAAAGSAQKPTSFLRSLWNAIVMDDDGPSWNQHSQETDPAKCIETITKTQQHLREFFQLAVCIFIPLKTG